MFPDSNTILYSHRSIVFHRKLIRTFCLRNIWKVSLMSLFGKQKDVFQYTYIVIQWKLSFLFYKKKPMNKKYLYILSDAAANGMLWRALTPTRLVPGNVKRSSTRSKLNYNLLSWKIKLNESRDFPLRLYFTKKKKKNRFRAVNYEGSMCMTAAKTWIQEKSQIPGKNVWVYSVLIPSVSVPDSLKILSMQKNKRAYVIPHSWAKRELFFQANGLFPNEILQNRGEQSHMFVSAIMVYAGFFSVLISQYFSYFLFLYQKRLSSSFLFFTF